MKGKWLTNAVIALGALIMIVPTIWVLQKSRIEFSKECASICYPLGMDYKIVSTGFSGYDRYPATCDCVPVAPKKWWQLWKSDPPVSRP